MSDAPTFAQLMTVTVPRWKGWCEAARRTEELLPRTKLKPGSFYTLDRRPCRWPHLKRYAVMVDLIDCNP